MARDIDIGDEVAVIATVLKRIDAERVALSIPSYNFPLSIRDAKLKKGDEIELAGEVTRVDDDKVTVRGEGGTLTLDAGAVRLVRKYRPPQRRTPLRDKPD